MADPLAEPGYPGCHGSVIAPLCMGMLQASYMRKWMTERLKRRKKPGEGSAKEAAKAPEPLQPRFYDNEPAAPTETPADAPVVESRHVSKPEAEPISTSALASAATEARPRTARRRRSRGGRGGSRQRPASAASAPADDAIAGARASGTASAESSATLAPTQTVPTPARASKGTVVLAIGLPGSGKSSWFKRHSIHPLSSDLLRELLFDDAQEQRFQDLVFSNLRSMLKARLIARRPMNYVDATNLTPQDRHSWIKLAKDYGYDVQGVFFDVPLEVCMERHQRRGRAVPEEIMRKMAGKLKAPTFDEGFSKITVVRVKQKEEAAGS
jgi:predicted kinase